MSPTKTPKKPTTRIERLDADIELLDRSRLLSEEADARLAAARAGHPPSSDPDSGSSGRGGAVSSPVERLIGEDGTIRDPAARGRRDRDKALRLINQGAELYARYVSEWAPRPADAKAKREAEIANHTHITCSHCTRWRGAGNAEPMFRHSDVGGRLDHPMVLGKYCYDFVLRTDEQLGEARLPTEAEIRRNERGQKVMLHASVAS